MKPPAYNSLLDLLSRETPEDVMAMRDPVQDLLEHPGWKLVSKFLNKRVDAIRAHTEYGVHEQAEYAKALGEITGLRSVEAVADAIGEAANRAEQALSQLAAGLAAGDTP